MSTRTTIKDTKPEGATAVLYAILTDVDGVTPLAQADTVLATLTLLLYDEATQTPINMVGSPPAARDVKNANGGRVYGSVQTLPSGQRYNLEIRLDPDDMVILSAALPRHESHVALLEWTWGSPRKTGRAEVAFWVTNLEKVP